MNIMNITNSVNIILASITNIVIINDRINFVVNRQEEYFIRNNNKIKKSHIEILLVFMKSVLAVQLLCHGINTPINHIASGSDVCFVEYFRKITILKISPNPLQKVSDGVRC